MRTRHAILGLAVLLLPGAAPPPRAARIACPPVAGLSPAVLTDIARRRFVVVGEKHGTAEYPAFFYGLVCRVAQTRAVAVSLELTEDATPAVRRYVASAGTAADRDALLASPVWDMRYTDGRSSAAILDLIERLRRLREAGAAITVEASQPVSVTLGDQHYGELERADLWAKSAARQPDAVTLILVGTAHAARADDGGLGFLPAAGHLRRADTAVLLPADEGGSAWSLDMSPTGRPDMGPHPLATGKARAGIARCRGRCARFDYRYAIGHPLTLSPPASSAALPPPATARPVPGSG